MTDTTAGLAMRSTDRASPLLLLGTSMLLGAGVSALARSVRLAGLASLGGGDRARLRGEPSGVQRDDGRRQLHPAIAAADVPHRSHERIERSTGRVRACCHAGVRNSG